MNLSGLELLAALVTAIFAGLGVYILRATNAKTALMKAETDHLKEVINLSDQMNRTIIGTQDTQIRTLFDTVQTVQKENQVLHSADENMRRENGQLRVEIDSVRVINQRVSDENNHMRLEMGGLHGRVDQLERENDGLKSQVAELKTDNVLLRDRVAMLEAENTDLKCELSKVKKKTGSLENPSGGEDC
jgi:chromosome segregation ATPase